MVEDHETVVETHETIGQFKVVHRSARKFRFNEVFQIVAPIAETAAERERKIDLVEQFVARHQTVKQVPWVAELRLNWSADFSPLRRMACLGRRNKFRVPLSRAVRQRFNLASRSKRSKRQTRTRRHERIARLR